MRKRYKAAFSSLTKPNSLFFPLTFEADGSTTNSTVAANPSCYTTYFWFPRSTLDSSFQQEVFPSPLITCINETASHYSYTSFCNSSFKFRRLLTKRPKISQAWSSEKPAKFPRWFQEALSESLQWLHAPRNTEKGSGPGKAATTATRFVPQTETWGCPRAPAFWGSHSSYCSDLQHEEEA